MSSVPASADQETTAGSAFADGVRRRAAALRPLVRIVRSIVLLGMFGGAVVAGIVVYTLQAPAPSPGTYPSVPTTAEPAAAHEIVELIVADDAPALASKLDAESLQALAGALSTVEPAPQPLVTVTSVKYLGAVALEEQTVVSYLARGRDAAGTDWVVGFALRVQGDEVVGVN